MKKPILFAGIILSCVLLSSCSHSLSLYTDVDASAAIKLADAFTQKTGIPVRVIHYSNAADMADAIYTYADGAYKPAAHDSAGDYADVVLSKDIAAGEVLKSRGALAEYVPANAATIPVGAKADGLWYGMGGRAWVLAWNTTLVTSPMAHLTDLASADLPKAAVAMPNPNYMLYFTCGECAIRGEDAMKGFLQTLIDKDTHWMASPAETANLVADGQAWACLTTLEQAKALKAAGKPVDWALPDQGEGEAGTYLLYNTVCLCSTSKMPEEAKQLENFLLAPETEALSVTLGISDATVRNCTSEAPAVAPLKTDLASAQAAMQNDLGTFLAWFTPTNPDYKGK